MVKENPKPKPKNKLQTSEDNCCFLSPYQLEVETQYSGNMVELKALYGLVKRGVDP